MVREKEQANLSLRFLKIVVACKKCHRVTAVAEFRRNYPSWWVGRAAQFTRPVEFPLSWLDPFLSMLRSHA